MIKDTKSLMIQWNRRFPIDRWWRQKHNVAFLSKEHRESSFLDQLFEFEEDQFFKELREEKEKRVIEYTPNMGEFFKDELDLMEEEVEPQSLEESVAAFRKEMAELAKLEELEKEKVSEDGQTN